MRKRQREKLGNIYAIPLPDKTFAFGRLYKERLAIAKERSDNISAFPDFKNIDFFVGVYKDVLTDGEWPIVGNMPFKDGEDIWSPKTYIQDQMHPERYEIYEKGKIRKSTHEECIGLEETAVWDRNHVVDRLMGIDTWTKICE